MSRNPLEEEVLHLRERIRSLELENAEYRVRQGSLPQDPLTLEETDINLKVQIEVLTTENQELKSQLGLVKGQLMELKEASVLHQVEIDLQKSQLGVLTRQSIVGSYKLTGQITDWAGSTFSQTHFAMRHPQPLPIFHCLRHRKKHIKRD
jgi:hypothetical protein